MTVGHLIDQLAEAPEEAGVFIGRADGTDGLADSREAITAVHTTVFEPSGKVGYVAIYAGEGGE